MISRGRKKSPPYTAILAGLGPYRTEHINWLGDYTLDMDRAIRPMNYKTQIF